MIYAGNKEGTIKFSWLKEVNGEPLMENNEWFDSVDEAIESGQKFLHDKQKEPIMLFSKSNDGTFKGEIVASFQFSTTQDGTNGIYPIDLRIVAIRRDINLVYRWVEEDEAGTYEVGEWFSDLYEAIADAKRHAKSQ